MLQTVAINNFIILNKMFIVTEKAIDDTVILDDFLYSCGELEYPNGELVLASNYV